MTMKREAHAKITEMNGCAWYHAVVQQSIDIAACTCHEDKEHNLASAWIKQPWHNPHKEPIKLKIIRIRISETE